jgi:hypothetical protein
MVKDKELYVKFSLCFMFLKQKHQQKIQIYNTLENAKAVLSLDQIKIHFQTRNKKTLLKTY